MAQLVQQCKCFATWLWMGPYSKQSNTLFRSQSKHVRKITIRVSSRCPCRVIAAHWSLDWFTLKTIVACTSRCRREVLRKCFTYLVIKLNVIPSRGYWQANRCYYPQLRPCSLEVFGNTHIEILEHATRCNTVLLELSCVILLSTVFLYPFPGTFKLAHVCYRHCQTLFFLGNKLENI